MGDLRVLESYVYMWQAQLETKNQAYLGEIHFLAFSESLPTDLSFLQISLGPNFVLNIYAEVLGCKHMDNSYRAIERRSMIHVMLHTNENTLNALCWKVECCSSVFLGHAAPVHRSDRVRQFYTPLPISVLRTGFTGVH